MSDKDGNQIKITIFGQEYSVKAPADPTYIKKIAEYVDTKMREVQSGVSSTQSSNRIAILSAMNITDELFNAKKRGFCAQPTPQNKSQAQSIKSPTRN